MTIPSTADCAHGSAPECCLAHPQRHHVDRVKATRPATRNRISQLHSHSPSHFDFAVQTRGRNIKAYLGTSLCVPRRKVSCAVASHARVSLGRLRAGARGGRCRSSSPPRGEGPKPPVHASAASVAEWGIQSSLPMILLRRGGPKRSALFRWWWEAAARLSVPVSPSWTGGSSMNISAGRTTTTRGFHEGFSASWHILSRAEHMRR